MHWNPDPDLYPVWLRSRIDRGKGMGVGQEYLPWLRVRDVPSIGSSSQVDSVRIPRVFHFLSSLETTYFYILERDETVLDIREQFPILILPETLKIASKLNIKHHVRNGKPEPLTIDFLLTIKTSAGIKYVARSIKTPEDAKDPEIKLKLLVEAIWCEQHGISWKLVDTKNFTPMMLETLRSLRSWHQNHLIPNKDFADKFATVFLDKYQTNTPLSRLLELTFPILNIDSFAAMDWFKFCAWSKRIPISLQSRITLADVVVFNHG